MEINEAISVMTNAEMLDKAMAKGASIDQGKVRIGLSVLKIKRREGIGGSVVNGAFVKGTSALPPLGEAEAEAVLEAAEEVVKATSGDLTAAPHAKTMHSIF